LSIQPAAHYAYLASDLHLCPVVPTGLEPVTSSL
jgi:hypothetical protein